MKKLVIEYCTACNYYPRAATLAESLKRNFDIDATLVKSQGGVFEIRWGDELLFSKKKLGRFPEPGEVERVLEAHLGASAAGSG